MGRIQNSSHSLIFGKIIYLRKGGIFMAEQKQKPLLTIGMIFKNEIRCLERCLQSLQPLREAIPCELVMADTGSDDGSRRIAEKYADILFDFPWINDFAAARNAVMDKSHGKWYLTIDADEWLEDIDELVLFLRTANSRSLVRSGQAIDQVFLISRSYDSYSAVFRDNYMDLLIPRMMFLATGMRYSGAIHEVWRFPEGHRAIKLSQTILHHDGYVGMNHNDEAGKAKFERNIRLLRDELMRRPDDFRTLTECVDASNGDEKWDYACRLVELVQQKKSGWQAYGANAFSSAVNAAIVLEKYDKMEEWAALAEEMFPQTYVVRLDMEVHSFQLSWNKQDYADCIRRGERFLQAYADYHAGRGDSIKNYAVAMSGPRWKSHIEIFMAYALCKEREYEKDWKMLQNLDWQYVDEKETLFFMRNLMNLQSFTDYDVAVILLGFWQQINQPDFARAEECQKAFAEEGACAFWPVNLAKGQKVCVKRPAYTLFLPLGETQPLGIAARLMEEEDQAELERLLALVDDLQAFPQVPLCRAILAGAKFPVKPLDLAAMDSLAARLTAMSPDMTAKLTIKASEEDCAADLQSLLWVRELALAAVRNWDWLEDGKFELARAFAVIEKRFLERYYAPKLLCTENIGLLPPMHVFGWYYAQAFVALENDDALGYVRLLRQGLEFCSEMKEMVKFLAKNTPELQERPEPSAEIQALAERIGAVLSAYSPDDPAVAAIKSSPAYRQVAYLIEDNLH